MGQQRQRPVAGSDCGGPAAATRRATRYAPSYGGGIVTSIVYWIAAAPAGVDSVMI
jgi:hypothetical protein